ncbi:hypothetical protein [Paraburkholderia tuberum]|uniref:DUF2971 domain-containing protein n=1 Tax=Paraburkholderia tuberum TaxID=157910 RepID=A0A1H1GYQ3_9BURK|nr:hypothetical protein [Paraburkholderia tuberum]SDR18324.1 hypothetical protein SAMN05445850_3164 [Paraburkholderia tuberum]
MRKIPVVMKDGMGRPDWPEGEAWPPLDENIVGVVCNGKEYIIYEEGDDLPPQLKTSVRFLRDIPDDTVVWRYMQDDRFLDLLKKQAIYFTPGYKLRRGEDYELRVPVRLAETEAAYRGELLSSWISDSDELARRLAAEEWSDDAKYLCMKGISCWHVNPVENHAMWQIYVGKERSGVAIKSTVGRLKRAIDTRKRYVHADMVTYIDYSDGTYERHPSATGYERIYSKSHFYRFENELRIVYDYPGFAWEYDDPQQRQALLKERPPARFAHTDLSHFLTNFPYVPVNLHELILEVVVRGVGSSTYLDEVKAIAKQYLSPDTTIVASAVYKWPNDDLVPFHYDPTHFSQQDNNVKKVRHPSNPVVVLSSSAIKTSTTSR